MYISNSSIFWQAVIIAGFKSDLKNISIPKSIASFVDPEERNFINLNASLNLEIAGFL